MSESSDVRVLLVEDHPDVAEMTIMMLQMLGAQATHVANVATARQRLRDAPFELVLADYRLPDGTGMDVLRDLSDQPGITGVLLSGYGSDAPLSDADRGLGIEVIAKPVELNQLEELLRTARQRADAAGPPA